MKTIELEAIGYGRRDALFAELSIRNWRELETDFGQDESWDELLAKLSGLFEWLAGNPSRPASVAPNGVALRLWCLFYAVRPDLISHGLRHLVLARVPQFKQSYC